jgi:hypothetical protein
MCGYGGPWGFGEGGDNKWILINIVDMVIAIEVVFVVADFTPGAGCCPINFFS